MPTMGCRRWRGNKKSPREIGASSREVFEQFVHQHQQCALLGLHGQKGEDSTCKNYQISCMCTCGEHVSLRALYVCALPPSVGSSFNVLSCSEQWHYFFPLHPRLYIYICLPSHSRSMPHRHGSFSSAEARPGGQYRPAEEPSWACWLLIIS